MGLHPGPVTDVPADHGFCPDCGQRLSQPDGDPRARCSCGFVRYRNPVVGVAVVVSDDQGRVLLGRRAKGEYAGLWCIPCGYVEWDEDVRDAARREFEEETGLQVDVTGVAAVHSNFHNAKQHTVGIWFAGHVTGGLLEPMDGELTELAFFEAGTPPELAFPTDGLVLADLAARASTNVLDRIDHETDGRRCDVSPLFADGQALAVVAERLAAPFRGQVDVVAGVDALGFVLGTAIARELGVGLLTVRKGGKLPVETLREDFVDYSGDRKALEVRADALTAGDRVLIADEWIETGAQVSAATKLIERGGGVVAGVVSINIDSNAATDELRARYRCVDVVGGG